MHSDTTATRRLDLVAQFDTVRVEGKPPVASLDEAIARSLSHRFIRPPIGGTLVHVATPAIWPKDRRDPPPGVSPSHYAEIRRCVAALSGDTVDALEAARDRATDASLTLGRLDPDVVTDLLWHGYMLTMTNFAVFDGQPYEPRPRKEFSDFVDSAKAAVRLRAAA